MNERRYEAVTIHSAGGETVASFVPALNLVCCSLVHRGTERLAMRRGLEAYGELGKTMGIPLLYPWANRLDRFGYEAAGQRVSLPQGDERIPLDGRGLPIHGVLPSLLRWELLDPPASDALAARLSWSAPKLLELFPYRHEVLREVRLSDGELVMITVVRANGGDPVPVSFGYHPYLRVGSAPRDSWELELGAHRRLRLDERGIPTGEREPVTEPRMKLGTEDWDVPFDAVDPPARFSVWAGELEMSVTFRAGYKFAQLFAPAEEQFICFEPMTAASDALNSGDGLEILTPGKERRAEFAISILDRSAAASA